MIGAIIQGNLTVNNRVACQYAVLHCALDTLVNRLDVFLRNRTADNLVDELVALARLVRLEDDLDMTILALTAGLTCVLALDVSRLADGLLVGYLRLAYVCLNLELTQQTVDNDLQMELAHACNDGLAG